MKSLLVFAAILFLAIGVTSCQKSEATPIPGEDKTLVQIDIVMPMQLDEMQKLNVLMAAEQAVMSLEEAGAPAMSPRIVIGAEVIYPRGQ